MQVRKKRAKYNTTPKKACVSCGLMRPLTDYYVSSSTLALDGKVSICKDCIKNSCYNEKTDDVDLDKFKQILRQIDKPFIAKYWNAAVDEFNARWYNKNVPERQRLDIIGKYIKNISTMRQVKSMTWVDSYRFGEHVDVVRDEHGEKRLFADEPPSQFEEDVSPETVKLFGEGYTTKEYKAMDEKYRFLIQNYPGNTTLHIEALVTYVRFKVKAEMATARGDVDEAKSWEELAQKAADKAKINPSQLSRKDMQGGTNSFSEVFQALEQTQDVREITPEFKFRPNDAVDFTIWCYINYCRRLEGKPEVEYADIYKFYDERKKEYIEQYGDPYGIFKDDPTEGNREKVKTFIQLPSDFNDNDAAVDIDVEETEKEKSNEQG